MSLNKLLLLIQIIDFSGAFSEPSIHKNSIKQTDTNCAFLCTI